MGSSPIRGVAYFMERAETLHITVDFAIKVGLWLRLRRSFQDRLPKLRLNGGAGNLTQHSKVLSVNIKFHILRMPVPLHPLLQG